MGLNNHSDSENGNFEDLNDCVQYHPKVRSGGASDESYASRQYWSF